MEYIDKVLATKPTDERCNDVYATNVGWCVKQKFKAKEEEVVYEFKSLLTILEEHGYDMYGVAIDDASEPTDNGGESGGATDNTPADGIDVDTTDNVGESDDINSDGDDITDPDGGKVDGDIQPTEDAEGSDDASDVDADVTNTEGDGGEGDKPVDDSQPKYTREYLESLPDMKSVREVAKEFDVSDIAKAKLIDKILEAQANG
ncbi:hypothetical protein MYOV003v1_p0090 [Vibrio phage 207E48.1]|nr:hypothetical protein MYOV003v1_p0090 [Vibrio phage 207E48.1]